MALAYFTLFFRTGCTPTGGGSSRWNHLSGQVYIRAYSGVWRGIPCDLNRTNSFSCQTAFTCDASQRPAIL